MLEAILIGAAAWAIIAAGLDSHRSTAALWQIPLEAYLANIAAGIINGAWCYC